MWEDDRTVDVVVSVHRVNPVNKRNPEPALECPRLELVVGSCPPLGGDVVGIGVATAQYRAQGVAGDIGLVVDGLEISLGHLADLLVQGHGLEQFLRFRRGRRVVIRDSAGCRDTRPPIAGKTAVAERTSQLKVR